MKHLSLSDIKSKGKKVVDQNGHQVYGYQGPPGGGVPGLPTLVTNAMAEADGAETIAQLAAAIKNQNFRVMIPEDLDVLLQEQKETWEEALAAEGIDQWPPPGPPEKDQPTDPSGEAEDQPTDEGGEGSES